MLCIVEIGMLVGGIVLLAVGKFPLGNRVSEGVGPRLAGLVLLLPLPLAFGIGMIIGANMAARGVRIDQTELALKFAPLELGIIGVCFIVALAIVLGTAKVPQRRRRADDYDE